jgi:hypothetical protein
MIFWIGSRGPFPAESFTRREDLATHDPREAMSRGLEPAFAEHLRLLGCKQQSEDLFLEDDSVTCSSHFPASQSSA